MSTPIQYNFDAARSLITDEMLSGIEADLLAARDETYADVDLLRSGGEIPAGKQPLDSGFIDMPHLLLDEYEKDGDSSLLGRMKETGAMLRDELDRLVVLGIGGSYMGLRALFEALCDPFHNELKRDERGDVPRLYFEGNNVDNDNIRSLMDLLKNHCTDSTDFAQRWGICVISKSGGTLETAMAFRIYRQALEEYYGADSAEAKRYVVPVTGDVGKLRDFSNKKGYPATFPIPDGVGGRFSVLTAVGLLPAAVIGIDIEALLQGAADLTDQCKTAGMGENPVLDYTAVCHLAEKEHGMVTRLLSTWGKKLEAAGLWYDQLLAESLGKDERGALPLTVVNTRDLHSRGQQHQEGARDKMITNVIVDEPNTAPIPFPTVPEEENQDQINKYGEKTIPDVLTAALQGTNKAYADVNRPTADLRIPKLDAYSMGQFFQWLMLATAVEGRLIGINPYGQPGVEAYKQNMNAILSQS